MSEYRIQNTEYRIQNTEYRIQNTEYRIQSRLQITDYRLRQTGVMLRTDEECVELYDKQIRLSRWILGIFLVVGCLIPLVFLVARRRRQSPTSPATSKSRGVRLLVATLTLVILWQSIVYTWITQEELELEMTTPSFNLSMGIGMGKQQQQQQRFVFSFTTTASGVNKTQPTLDSLLSQKGTRGFDAIYVIVPQMYRSTKVEMPQWLLTTTTTTSSSSSNATSSHSSFGWKFTLHTSTFDSRVHIVVLEKDFGPASKLLGTLLVEKDPNTIIVYGDDDRLVPSQLASRILFYSRKYGSTDALGVMGGWVGQQTSSYCGRSLELGVNSVSMLGGAGIVAVRRKFYDETAFDVMKLSKSCFLGDDFYLSYILHRRKIRRRLIYDSCWTSKNIPPSYNHLGLSMQKSSHPGGPNVANYQNCMAEVGDGVAWDGEFGYFFMNGVAQLWGLFRGVHNFFKGDGFVPC